MKSSDGAPTVPRAKPTSYYGRPVLKPPVWTWEIPVYFFTGGLGGASATLALASKLAGNNVLARTAWRVAFAGISISPALLIADLGRPLRFFNMLRMAKATSPMSVGSWVLMANGAAVTGALAASELGAPRRLTDSAQLASGILGLPLATYTAVLLSNTAVPVWSEARWELPTTFAASAAASAGAAAAALSEPDAAGPARRLAVGAAITEAATTIAMERRLGSLGRHYSQGRIGLAARAAKALSVGGAGLLAAGGARFPRVTRIGAGLILASSLAYRWTVVAAGTASAEAPEDTIGPQRERVSERPRPESSA